MWCRRHHRVRSWGSLSASLGTVFPGLGGAQILFVDYKQTIESFFQLDCQWVIGRIDLTG